MNKKKKVLVNDSINKKVFTLEYWKMKILKECFITFFKGILYFSKKYFLPRDMWIKCGIIST